MRFVIAGATGLIGSAVSDALGRLGHSVTILTRRLPPPSVSPEAGVRYVQWDAAQPGPWTSSLEGADAVLNLSGSSLGEGRWSARRKQRILSSRVGTTRLLVEAIARSAARPGALVNASAVGYYGHVARGEVTEDHPPGGDFLASVCVQWESEAAKAMQLGVRVAILRTGFVLSPHAPGFRRLVLPFRLFLGGSYGDGKQWFPWVHLSDVVATYVNAATDARYSGPINVVAPGQVTMGEFCRTAGLVMQRPSWLTVPAPVLRMVLGEMADLLLSGQQAVPRKLESLGFGFQFPSAQSALRDVLGR